MGGCLFCDELESHSSDGFQFYGRLVFQCRSDFLDEYIQASGSEVILVFHAPEAAQYGFPAHHLVLVYRQQFEDLSLSCGKHFLAALLCIFQGGVVGIQCISSQLDLAAGILAALSGFQLDEAVDVCIQLFRDERLLDIVVGSCGITCLQILGEVRPVVKRMMVSPSTSRIFFTISMPSMIGMSISDTMTSG